MRWSRASSISRGRWRCGWRKPSSTQVIDRAVAEVEQHTPPLDVRIYKNYSPDIPPFLLDRQLMERVLYNLLLNAAQASPPQRQRHGEDAPDWTDTVEIAVIDRGSGIDPKHLENIFNPFFTTKSQRRGTGPGHRFQDRRRARRPNHGGKRTRRRQRVSRVPSFAMSKRTVMKATGP